MTVCPVSTLVNVNSDTSFLKPCEVSNFSLKPREFEPVFAQDGGFCPSFLNCVGIVSSSVSLKEFIPVFRLEAQVEGHAHEPLEIELRPVGRVRILVAGVGLAVPFVEVREPVAVGVLFERVGGQQVEVIVEEPSVGNGRVQRLGVVFEEGTLILVPFSSLATYGTETNSGSWYLPSGRGFHTSGSASFFMSSSNFRASTETGGLGLGTGCLWRLAKTSL